MPVSALSIVIPAYNESARIEGTLDATRRWLDSRGMGPTRVEVLVVDDGSRDDTCAKVERHAAEDRRIRLLRQPLNLGKGAAVRRGMLEATAPRVLFMDADLATPLDEYDTLARALDGGADIAIASRALAGSNILVRQHPMREAMGKSFNLLVRAIGGLPFLDTQCGFKLFTRAAAQDLFAAARVDRFAFDVEILLLAQGRYRVEEVPVAWQHVEQSKISPLRDAARMAVDLAKLRAGVEWRKARASRRR